jgi:hypothetical protein
MDIECIFHSPSACSMETVAAEFKCGDEGEILAGLQKYRLLL